MASVEQVSLKDIDMRLRSIIKLLESNANVDIRNRQRVVIDGVGSGTSGVTTELAASVPVTVASATVLSAGGNGITLAPPYTIASITPQVIWEGPVDQRWRIIEASRQSFAQIRNLLVWS